MNKNSLKETKVIHEVDNLQMNIYHNNYRFYLHWHDEFEFIYGIEGNSTVFVDGCSYPLGKGELLLVEGGSLHSKNGTDYNRSVSTVIHPHLCGADCLGYFKKNISYPRLFKRGDVVSDKVIDNILTVNKCFEDKAIGYELRIKSLVCDTFALLLENGRCTVTESISPANEAFKQLIDFVHSGYKSKITLDGLSARSNYSKSYIIRLFKKHTGKTPVEYINDYRLSHSAKLLSNTDMSVLDVSLECGFENTGYFIKLFKNKFGTTPLKWKNGQNSI